MLDKLVNAEPSLHIEEPNKNRAQMISKFNKKEHLLEQLKRREQKKHFQLPIIIKDNPIPIFSEEDMTKYNKNEFKLI